MFAPKKSDIFFVNTSENVSRVSTTNTRDNKRNDYLKEHTKSEIFIHSTPLRVNKT